MKRGTVKRFLDHSITFMANGSVTRANVDVKGLVWADSCPIPLAKFARQLVEEGKSTVDQVVSDLTFIYSDLQALMKRAIVLSQITDMIHNAWGSSGELLYASERPEGSTLGLMYRLTDWPLNRNPFCVGITYRNLGASYANQIVSTSFYLDTAKALDSFAGSISDSVKISPYKDPDGVFDEYNDWR